MENMENKIICVCCGKEIEEEDIAFYDEDGLPVCYECEDEYETCEDCGNYFRRDEMYEMVNGRYICETCVAQEDRYKICEDCGRVIDTDFDECYTIHNSRNDEVYYVCEECMSDTDNYRLCANCDQFFETDDMVYDENSCDYYCQKCIDNHLIRDYHYFSDWENHYVSNKYESSLKGFELEVENKRGDLYNNEMASKIKEIAGDFFVFENDGSLDDGFENISNPFTMDWLYDNQDMIKEVLKALQDNGFASHDTYTCGLHIHVNRDYLERDTTLEEDQVINNIIVIMETFKNELLTFSRREEGEMNRWACFMTEDDEEISFKLINKKKQYIDRYQALNLVGRNTIEFRIFKGTLNFESLMSCIELVDNIVEIAKREDINGITWNDIISYGNSKYVYDYSCYNRGIKSDTTVNVVYTSFSYECGDLVRVEAAGCTYIGEIDYISYDDETFTLKGLLTRFDFENVVTGEFDEVYRIGDVLYCIPCRDDLEIEKNTVCEVSAKDMDGLYLSLKNGTIVFIDYQYLVIEPIINVHKL